MQANLRTWNNRLVNYEEESLRLLIEWDKFSDLLIKKEKNGIVEFDSKLDTMLTDLISDTNDLLTANRIEAPVRGMAEVKEMIKYKKEIEDEP